MVLLTKFPDLNFEIWGEERMAEDFSIIIIPDTQDLSTSKPEKLLRMTKWIANNASQLNLKMVLHVGDVVNRGLDEDEYYWQSHQTALNILEQANIPFMNAIGNHDYDNLLRDNRDSTIFNQYCGMDWYNDKQWFGAAFQENKTENMYTKLDIEGEKYLFLSMEFGPRDEVIDWANEVLFNNQDHRAIILTHSYMYLNGERTKPGYNHNPKDYPGTSDANDGEDLWNKCISKHKNIISVFSGHHITDNISYRFDFGDHGNLVFQSFQNWQCAADGGDGRFRILRFDLDENKASINVFNPQTEKNETAEGYEVEFPINQNIDHQKWLDERFPVNQ